MNEYSLHTKSDEQVISLGEMFIFLLKRWKSIVLISAIGVLIGFVQAKLEYQKQCAIDRTAIDMNHVDMKKIDNYFDLEKQINYLSEKIETYDIDQKFTAMNMINNYKNTRESIINNLNWDEKAYFSKTYLNVILEKSVPSISYKPVILYFVIGAFIICFIYAMKYIFNHQVKTATELNDTFGLHVIGVYKASKENKGIAGLLEKKESKNDLVSNTKDYIVKAVEELNKSPLILLCNSEKDIVNNAVDEISTSILGTKKLGYLQNDSLAITESHKSNGVILVVSLWDTLIDEVNREVEIALVHNIDIIGCIVIK